MFRLQSGEREAVSNLAIALLLGRLRYGIAFESFLINEILRLEHYQRKDYKLSYLRTKSGVEIDLIVERPRGKIAAIEIKSTSHIRGEDLKSFSDLGSALPNSELFCFSCDPHPKKIDRITCLPWREGLSALELC